MRIKLQFKEIRVKNFRSSKNVSRKVVNLRGKMRNFIKRKM